jgi:hypothetical protein
MPASASTICGPLMGYAGFFELSDMTAPSSTFRPDGSARWTILRPLRRITAPDA